MRSLKQGDAEDSGAFLSSMRAGRANPATFDDALIERIFRVYGERTRFITIYREQLLRWQIQASTAAQRVDIARLSERQPTWGSIQGSRGHDQHLAAASAPLRRSDGVLDA
ncbi:MAG TPA: hypothetical protein VFH51_00240, partial [Myxococcota bacterium]|nr:hypothetical protein [Myxococcota bacterium]